MLPVGALLVAAEVVVAVQSITVCLQCSEFGVAGFAKLELTLLFSSRKINLVFIETTLVVALVCCYSGYPGMPEEQHQPRTRLESQALMCPLDPV